MYSKHIKKVNISLKTCIEWDTLCRIRSTNRAKENEQEQKHYESETIRNHIKS